MTGTVAVVVASAAAFAATGAVVGFVALAPPHLSSSSRPPAPHRLPSSGASREASVAASGARGSPQWRLRRRNKYFAGVAVAAQGEDGTSEGGGGGGPKRWLSRLLGSVRNFKLKDAKRFLPLIALSVLVVVSIVRRSRARRHIQEVALSSFLDLLQQPSAPIRQAVIGASSCAVLLDDGRRLFTRWPLLASPVAQELWESLRRAKVTIVAEKTSSSPYMLFSAAIMIMYLFFVYTMLRRMNGGGDGGKSWKDSRKQVMQSQEGAGSLSTASKFQDVAGVDEAKDQVMEVVQMLRSPEPYATLGARVPRGVLMVGPPGSGKTLLARACAVEAGVPFLNTAATEFVEVYVGRGAQRVRQLFERARKLAPCIVFIDEIDALRARGNDFMRTGGNSEAENTLNQLLTCMDGLVGRGSTSDKPVVVIGATNRPEVLDEALLRPGRFDRIVKVDLPNARGRKSILGVHLRLKQVPLAPDVDDKLLTTIAERSDGLAGAALESLVNEAAIRAARRYSSTVAAQDLEQALSEFKRSREGTGPRPFPFSL
mmetsp:Transcript_126268/g.404173  ORF Transcript_126268/g.404173 Transcript_126268/m.404173 type:complete len:542 (-) Transcript_126268:123-1748(-)